MNHIHTLLLVTLCCPIAGAAQEGVVQKPVKEGPISPAPFIRLVEDGSWVRLEVAARSFSVHDSEGQPTGPRVDLCAAMHVGEAALYSGLQKQLDACEVVLFEGVGGRTIGVDTEGVTDSADRAAVSVSRRRMRKTAIAIARHRKNHGLYPKSLKQLEGLLPLGPKGPLPLFDCWDGALHYAVHPAAEEESQATFSLVSLGKDGQSGGEGPDRDLLFADQRPCQEWEIDDRSGIQQDMAVALGLVFQLDAMNHLGAQWRNSDATTDQLAGWLDHAGEDNTALLSALNGSSLVSDLIGNMLRLFSLSKTAQSMLRLVTIEVLARAEQVMQSEAAGLGDLMAVLLDRRNEIVLGDLHAILSQENPPQHIGIIYGAAHQSAFQDALGKHGFRTTGTVWRTAARVNLDDLGLPRAQVDWTRRALVRSLEQMLK